MHISEGVLAPAILGAGAVLTAAGMAVGLRALDYNRIMTVAMLSAAFFVGSLIHVPVGPANAHLVLNGLLGAVLGWAAFPSIFVALLLQSIFFQFGGITVLGVNTFNMAMPAVLVGLACRPFLRRDGYVRMASAFCCGTVALAGSAFFTALSLSFSEEGFIQAARILLLAHIPVMISEGVISMLVVSFLAKMQPELLSFASRRS